MHILDQLKDAFSRLVRHKPACTILAFRKLHLAVFFMLNLAFLGEELLKSVDAIVILLKSKPEKYSISQMCNLFYHEATL